MKMRVRNKCAWSDEVTNLEEKNLEVAYKAALEGIVLLENDGCLPIKPGKVALYGAGAEMTIKGGTGSGEVNERHAVSILEGLEDAGFTVTTKFWLEVYKKIYKNEEEAYKHEFYKKLLSLNPSQIMNIVSGSFQQPVGHVIMERDIKKSETDTCIYVVSRQAGEGADRRMDEYTLSDKERQSIELCARNYAKTIVVINVGCSFDMSFLDEIQGINAVIYLCQQGSRGGRAFADLLCGKVTPSGKLSDTWAFHYDDFPFANEYSYLNGNLAEEYYKEGIYVGYRYFDSFQVKPRYPFGYGLSYTNFEIFTESVEVEKDGVTVHVSVKNIGDTYSGKEVVQLYASCPQGELAKEYQKLVAFGKTSLLQSGDSEIVELKFKVSELASFCEKTATMILETGEYILRVGNSSRNTNVCGVLQVDQKIVTKQYENICRSEETVEEIVPVPVSQTGLLEGVVTLKIQAEDIVLENTVYETPDVCSSEVIDTLMEELSLQEMVSLTVGTGMGSGAYFHAPGSAGATTGKLLEKGIPNVCLADGPAGLRLQRRSAVMRNGKIKAVDPYLSLMNYIPEFAKKVVLADDKKHPIIYQFTTAFPVGIALAQTWNTELVEQVGLAVGEEMKAYGVTYWLAPALNIHRNPLCGRNFEYYSEDPLLSGKLAAAMTKGVQKHRGCYVTLKHFCCNNQEDNRNRTNANVSERALREIYLRGFEIAVKESNPGSIMTSYNKVNGVYANNSYDLNTKVLRNEWGFDGLVMTDWFATGNGLGSHALAIGAGNDLIMPGGPAAVREILKAVETGKIKEEDVKRCAANVLRGITSSRIYQAFKKRG